MIEPVLAAVRPLLAVAFTAWGNPVTWLELLALVLALGMVAANMKVWPVGWPLAILSSLLYAWLFAESKLYGEASLQIVFVVLAGWGWWQWLRGRAGDGQALQVRRLVPRHRWWVGAATLAAWPLLGGLLARATDSDVAYLDALPTVGSVAGQLLLARKLVENWAVWAVVNVLSVGLFAYKALWLTAALYAVFAVLSVLGWRAWQARLAGQPS